MHAHAMFQAKLAINESLEEAARERMFRNVRPDRSLVGSFAAAAARLRAALMTPVELDPDGSLPRLQGYPYRP